MKNLKVVGKIMAASLIFTVVVAWVFNVKRQSNERANERTKILEEATRIGDELVRLSHEFSNRSTAIGSPVKNPQQAAEQLRAYEDFCTAEEGLFSRLTSLGMVTPDKRQNQVIFDKACVTAQDMFRYAADPAHHLKMVDGQTRIDGADVYNQKVEAFQALQRSLFSRPGVVEPDAALK